MTLSHMVAVLVPFLGATVIASPATLNVTVMNGTTGKPAAGCEVALLSRANPLAPVASGRTDATGRCSFTVGDRQAFHVSRVIYQAVVYQARVPPGGGSFVVQVYDVAQTIDGVFATRNVQRLQAEGDTLQVIEEITVRNTSDPPRTLLNERPFEVQLSPEARIVAGAVRIGGGPPVRRKPAPSGLTGRYYFPFPLHPGETRFAVAYTLPYRGQTVIEPRILYPLKEFRVVLPKSMKFAAEAADTFHPMSGETGESVQVTDQVKPGQLLAFRISGSGSLGNTLSHQRQTQGVWTPTPGTDPDASAKSTDPRHRLRWPIIGGLAAGLAGVAAGAIARARKRSQPGPLLA